jgi:methyl-accepting chemotaxis protein
MDIESELRRAIASHGAMKLRLRLAVDTGTSDLTVAAMCRDDRCALGRWLYALDATTQDTMRWRCVRAVHAEFHEHAGAVLELALAGRPREARAAMSYSSAFAGTSAKLVAELMAWKSESARLCVAQT